MRLTSSALLALSPTLSFANTLEPSAAAFAKAAAAGQPIYELSYVDARGVLASVQADKIEASAPTATQDLVWNIGPTGKVRVRIVRPVDAVGDLPAVLWNRLSTLAIESCAIYIEGMTEPSASQANPLDHFLCFSVYAAGLAFNRVYKPLLDRFGITYPQYIALAALSSKDSQTVSELGEKLFLESNTLTPLIKRLEAAGLVSRTRDKQDERVVRLSLTEAGQSISDEALGCVPAEVLEATGMDHAALEKLNDEMVKLGSALRSNVGRPR